MQNPNTTLCVLVAAALAGLAGNAQTFKNQDVGLPTLAGSVTISGTQITVIGGGDDIWNNADNFHYYYTAVTGPFDLRVRAVDLQGPDAWTKAELMARQDDGTGIPQAGDPQISSMTTRVAGQNEVNMQWRQARDGASNWPGSPANPVRPSYPNTWLRLVRSGDLFMGFSSTNGVDWLKLYDIDTANTTAGWSPWPAKINLGLAVTAHNNADLTGGVAVFNDLQFATEPVLAASGNGGGLTLQILETSPALTVANVSTVFLDGTNISSKITQSRSGTVTTVKYDVLAATDTFFAPNSPHTLNFVFKDNLAVDHTNAVSFTVTPYVTIPASYAVTGVDTTQPGFKLRPYQTADAQPNSLLWTEEQFAGKHGANIADLVTIGADANGFVTNETYLNYDISASVGGVAHGNFTDANMFPEQPFPGIPGTTLSTANFALEALTYLQFPAPGFYTMGVNSDDGFRVTSSKNPEDIFTAAVLGYFDGGRGSSDTLFDFTIAQAGIYPFRLVYENGGGDANLEWFTVVNGQKILVNDTANASALKGYRSGPVGPALTRWVDPADGATGVAVTNAITFTLEDADTQVDPATIAVRFGGQTVAPVITKSGTTTTVVYDPPGNLASSSNYAASITWSDNATPAYSHAVQTRFVTERLASTLPAFQEDQNGLTVIEAENFHGLTPQGGSTWAWLTTDAGYAGDGEMQAVPNAGVNRGTYPDLLTTSPRLDYRVNFLKTGVHYIWVRGNAISGSDDSVHAGIDGDNPDTARRIDNSFSPNNQWVWAGKISTGAAATINVLSVGEHPVNFWMREDGFKIDRFLLTTDPAYTPAGAGPAESRHVGSAPPPSVAITSPANKATFPAGANIGITASASDVDGTIAKVEFFAAPIFGGTLTKIGEATSSPFTVTWNAAPAGRYSLKAAVTDNSGDTNVSAVVKIVVGNFKPLVVLVVGGDPAALNASDLGVKNRMMLFGYDVVGIRDTLSQTTDADLADFVITSSTVGSGNVADKFRMVPVPVMNWEQALEDNYLMTLDTADVDRGAVASQTNVVVVNETHPMAGGLTNGTYLVTTSPQTFTWGYPGPEAVIVATLEAGNACLYGYDKGVNLIDGVTKAPARRVHIFLENNAFAALTPDGLKLFDAAAAWALNTTLVPKQDTVFNAPVLQGGNITISWTGPGRLQEALAVTGPWNDSASQANPQTVTPVGPAKFYRVQQ